MRAWQLGRAALTMLLLLETGAPVAADLGRPGLQSAPGSTAGAAIRTLLASRGAVIKSDAPLVDVEGKPVEAAAALTSDEPAPGQEARNLDRQQAAGDPLAGAQQAAGGSGITTAAAAGVGSDPTAGHGGGNRADLSKGALTDEVATAAMMESLVGAMELPGQPQDSSEPRADKDATRQRKRRRVKRERQLPALEPDVVVQAYRDFQARLAAHPPRPRPDSKPRGIIIPAGGMLLVANAYVVVAVLREVHNCTLPIQIVHLGLQELDASTKTYLEEHFTDLEVIDLANAPYPAHHRKLEVTHYLFKAYAFYHSQFEQVLVLDADNVPLQDLTPLFESREFAEAGAIFWPDYWQTKPGPPTPFIMPGAMFQLFGLPPPLLTNQDRWFSSCESGQMLFDRKALPDVLEWSYWVNTYGPDFFYQVALEKESYQLAFSLAGKADKYRQVLQYPREVLCKRPRGKLSYLHVGMMQLDFAGRPLFFHRTDNTAKLDPAAPDYYTADFVSIPMSEEHAFRLFHAPEHGGSGFKAVEVREVGPADNCRFTPDGINLQAPLHKECNVAIGSEVMPVPIMSVALLSAGLQDVLTASYQAFERVKADIQQNKLLTHACKKYDDKLGIVC